ncbi:hypothetical protein GCM10011386_06690 [Parapedobacter defluvii]|uniref:Transmembrane protein n=2 Tax=Parapedobacter defluvii TaxID=2045106 RepID=A0ABQ1L669_9SPHI|nr:hypothetical protein [Parapedobacter defluvii]GGC17472.1 hypothetical protein GCM10011386_06690 [Parapedobacter defluvii]
MKWNNNIRTRLALLQVILFFLITASGTIFMHKHKTADGRIVIHTHPYNLKKDPDATKHHHSDSEIHLLDVVFQGSFLQPNFFYYEQPILTPVCMTYEPFRTSRPQTDFLHAVYLRGPPPTC